MPSGEDFFGEDWQRFFQEAVKEPAVFEQFKAFLQQREALIDKVVDFAQSKGVNLAKTQTTAGSSPVPGPLGSSLINAVAAKAGEVGSLVGMSGPFTGDLVSQELQDLTGHPLSSIAPA